jgi:hypothetical protein
MRKSEMLSMKIGDEVENIDISLEDYEKNKIERFKQKMKNKRDSFRK